MVNGILGKKVGMTQLFDDKGEVRPITVLQAGPCVITQKKNAGKDGYEAVQVGLEMASLLPPAASAFRKKSITTRWIPLPLLPKCSARIPRFGKHARPPACFRWTSGAFNPRTRRDGRNCETGFARLDCATRCLSPLRPRQRLLPS